MTTFTFYADMVDSSVQWYPTFVKVDAETREEAIQQMASENHMTIAEVQGNHVWMEMRDGAMVRYEV